jgi:hypothetical protein
MTHRSGTTQAIALSGVGTLTASGRSGTQCDPRLAIQQLIAEAPSSIAAGIALAHLYDRDPTRRDAIAAVVAGYAETDPIRIVARIEIELIAARARVEARRYSPEARRKVAEVSADLHRSGLMHREIREHLVWREMARKRGYPPRPAPPARYPDEGLPL